MNGEERLFGGNEHVDSVRDIYSNWQWDIREELDEWTPEQVLAAEPGDIARRLLAKCSITYPVLHREQAKLLTPSEDGDLTKLVLPVPFDGYAWVFSVRADGDLDWDELPRAQVTRGELRLTWADGTDGNPDPAAVRREFDRRLDKIEQMLSILRPGVEEAIGKLREEATRIVSSRREAILAYRKLATGLGIPVRQRAAGGLAAEAVPPEAQYQHALAVLQYASHALERSPLMTSHLDEERIRDLLLVVLNGQFKGAASGEVFNRYGKTDILIRAEDRNVFIAECKIWKGPKTIQDALGQLLNYLAWPDTNTALLLFIRSGEPTEIVKKSIAEIKKHPNFVRPLSVSEDGECYDCVLHANDHPGKEVRLAFISFALLDRQDEA